MERLLRGVFNYDNAEKIGILSQFFRKSARLLDGYLAAFSPFRSERKPGLGMLFGINPFAVYTLVFLCHSRQLTSLVVVLSEVGAIEVSRYLASESPLIRRRFAGMLLGSATAEQICMRQTPRINSRSQHRRGKRMSLSQLYIEDVTHAGSRLKFAAASNISLNTEQMTIPAR
jgi:hypothetical protein